MIIGTGIDIVDLRRFHDMDSDRLNRLAKRILTDDELVEFRQLDEVKQPLHLAKMWSIKESIGKGFGTGISNDSVWKNMRIYKNTLGQPQVQFLGALARKNVICHISVSHDGDYLVSNAVLDHVH
jgi:phosphopantetheine--protein transferase-like protein